MSSIVLLRAGELLDSLDEVVLALHGNSMLHRHLRAIHHHERQEAKKKNSKSIRNIKKSFKNG